MTDPADIRRLFDLQRAHRSVLRDRTARERADRIRAIRAALIERRDRIKEAMWADFRKAPESVDKTEILPVALEARHAARRVRRWMKPRRASTPLYLLGTTSRVHVEPKGNALIMAPWNYPVNLTIGPLISAVAAGCPAIIKPSEFVPATGAVIRELVESVFPKDEAAVVLGATGTATELLALPFDHIYFTGSTHVGRIVMKAAAEHLSSVTLELGGKSPTLVDESADIVHAARTIVFGKFSNCGQTCIAPDHVYVHASVFDRFTDELGRWIRKYYGDTAAQRRERPEFGRIVSERHAARLHALVDDAVHHGARVVHGERLDGDPSFVDATVLADMPEDSAIMREEIFGPLLPLVSYERIDDVLADLSGRPKPLALYVYSGERRRADHVLRGTSAGASIVNDALIHFLNLDLPFGGTGESGMGKGKGKAGFLAFSNERGVMRQHLRPPLLTLLHPPYTRWTRRLIDWLLRFF